MVGKGETDLEKGGFGYAKTAEVRFNRSDECVAA
jgi:hypothetical protein